MGTETSTARAQPGSLAELNSLIGRYITGEAPVTHWEDSHAQLRFDTLEEALEALREPYFQQFIPAEDRASTVLREVEEFRHYSTDLATAWELVSRLATAQGPLQLWRDGDFWHASFGKSAAERAATVPIVICLAALRARGVEVEFSLVGVDDPTFSREESLTTLLRAGMLAD